MRLFSDKVKRKFKSLSFKDYAEYIHSAIWKNFKTKFMSHSKRVKTMTKKYGRVVCESCHSADFINLHHRTYTRIGVERMGDVVILCRNCHSAVHKYHKDHSKQNIFMATKNALLLSLKNSSKDYERRNI